MLLFRTISLAQLRRCNALLKEVLSGVDIKDVEPMARPHDAVNRLDEDEPEPPLDRETVLDMAPDVEFPFLAVPKVFQEDGD